MQISVLGAVYMRSRQGNFYTTFSDYLYEKQNRIKNQTRSILFYLHGKNSDKTIFGGIILKI